MVAASVGSVGDPWPVAAVVSALMVSNVMVVAGGGPGGRPGWDPEASPVDIGGLVGPGAVVRIRPFRRLWLVLGLSALGDWLGL